jgi:hypothetical protein
MSEDGGHSGKIPHTWSNYLVDAPRPDTYERILAASALPGELILSEYERKRLNNAVRSADLLGQDFILVGTRAARDKDRRAPQTAAKDGEARATDQELVAAYRELPPSVCRPHLIIKTGNNNLRSNLHVFGQEPHTFYEE